MDRSRDRDRDRDRDRERERDRDRDRRSDHRGDGEVTRMGGGESYRPTARPRSPARANNFRLSDRDRRSPPVSDSYHPGERRRSRSPVSRRDRSPARESANWRNRQRSPRARSPPRRFSPRRDEDRRERRRSRSPYDRRRATPRARSPLPRRSRSPATGQRGAWRTRSRTPERREDRPSTTGSASWRRRSPSPTARDSERSSGKTSGNTSRRSSPHIHSSRIAIAPVLSRETKARSPPPRSPPAQLAYRDRDSAKSTPKERSPVRQQQPRSPPRGPAAFKAPTGPSLSRNFTAPTRSPVMTSSSVQSSVSAYNRQENMVPAGPPSGPRGYIPPSRGHYGGRGGRGSFGTERHNRPDWGAAPPSRPIVDTSTKISTAAKVAPSQSPAVSTAISPSSSIPTGPSSTIPTGPRAAANVPSRPSVPHGSSGYGSRTQSISAASGPRPHPAMAGLPQIISGGRIDPTATGLTSDVAARLKKREEEEQILREELKGKEEKLRKVLKTWDKLSRDSASMGLRSELSERHVRMLAGEGVGGAAF